MFERLLRAASIILAISALGVASAAAQSGGGPINLDIRDNTSAQIDAIHGDMVRRATALGAPVTTAVSPAVVTQFQYPLQFAPTASGFAQEGISNHVDHDTTTAIRDFACGMRTYNGHLGTDFFLWPYPWNVMDRGEDRVVAALPGLLVQKSDGAFDRQCQWSGNPPANYVVISHDNGLVGYYWHLKNGSVTTKAVGARVALGEQIGLVGSSGFSTGPHLHFEVRDGSNTVVDPYAGQCGGPTPQWTHQAKAIDPALLRIATHTIAPPTASNCNNPDPGYAARFSRGARVYAAAYLRDQQPSTLATIAILRPDGSVATSFTSSGPASGFWPAAYWYTSYTLPSNAPLGEWRVRLTFAGQTNYHSFVVQSATPATATVSAVVNSPVRAVSVGTAANFTVQIRNSSANRAVGCRLSLARPINADVTFRQLNASNVPIGPNNYAFAIPANSVAKARLMVTPRTGFTASGAEFPLIAKCMNSATAAFSRVKTMLTLTGS